MRKKLIAGNWKMNGDIAMAGTLSAAVVDGMPAEGVEVVLCPPFTALSTVAKILKGTKIALGGQDCHSAASGAHTGDIAANMLVNLGCRYVILGHSERRANHNESDADVRAKAAAAHAASLVAIICVGESEVQRDAGRAAVTVAKQIRGSVPDDSTAANTVIAYEPIWAIGTGRTPTQAQIAEIHDEMRRTIGERWSREVAESMRLLYGGSVNAENAAEILAIDGVDGALVGGASLKADSFLAIVKSCH